MGFSPASAATSPAGTAPTVADVNGAEVPALQVRIREKRVTVGKRPLDVLSEVNFDVRRQEVVGIATPS